MRLTAALFLSVLAFGIAAEAATPRVIEGYVTSVHDGDTFRIGDQSIRLWGVDAVELKQVCGDVACGEKARDTLAELISERIVTCTLKGKSHKRLVGHCFVGGRITGIDVGQYIAQRGMAFDTEKFSKGYYREDEAMARSGKRGLWALGSVDAPDHWRACNMAQFKEKRPSDCI